MLQKKLLGKVLAFVLPEVVKLIKPLRKYVDEPNELDEICEELEIKTDAMHDMLIQVGKTANTVESDLQKFKKKSEGDLSKLKNLEEMGPRLITLQAMVDKFDRDQDYLDQRIKDLTSIVDTLTMFKENK